MLITADTPISPRLAISSTHTALKLKSVKKRGQEKWVVKGCLRKDVTELYQLYPLLAIGTIKHTPLITDLYAYNIQIDNR